MDTPTPGRPPAHHSRTRPGRWTLHYTYPGHRRARCTYWKEADAARWAATLTRYGAAVTVSQDAGRDVTLWYRPDGAGGLVTAPAPGPARTRVSA